MNSNYHYFPSMNWDFQNQQNFYVLFPKDYCSFWLCVDLGNDERKGRKYHYIAQEITLLDFLLTIHNTHIFICCYLYALFLNSKWSLAYP